MTSLTDGISPETIAKMRTFYADNDSVELSRSNAQKRVIIDLIVAGVTLKKMRELTWGDVEITTRRIISRRVVHDISMESVFPYVGTLDFEKKMQEHKDSARTEINTLHYLDDQTEQDLINLKSLLPRKPNDTVIVRDRDIRYPHYQYPMSISDISEVFKYALRAATPTQLQESEDIPASVKGMSKDELEDNIKKLSRLVAVMQKELNTRVNQVEQSKGIPIEALDLSIRVFNSLKRTGICTVSEVLEMLNRGDDAMLAIRNFGKTSLDELICRLKEKKYLS